MNKIIAGNLLKKLYPNLAFDYEKNVIIVDRKLWVENGGTILELEEYLLRLRQAGNLTFFVGMGDSFLEMNKYSLLLELLRLNYFNDIVKDKSAEPLKRLCLINKQVIDKKGLSWRDFT